MVKITRICDKCGNFSEPTIVRQGMSKEEEEKRLSSGVVLGSDCAICQIKYICSECVHPDLLREKEEIVREVL